MEISGNTHPELPRDSDNRKKYQRCHLLFVMASEPAAMRRISNYVLFVSFDAEDIDIRDIPH